MAATSGGGIENEIPDWYDAIDDLYPITSVQRVAFIQRRDAGSDFHAHVVAAMAAADGRLTSVDHARRTYVDLDELRGSAQQDLASDVLREAYGLVVHSITFARRSLQPSPDDPPALGEFAASVALERLVASFKSAHLLYQLGHRTDADAVVRVILEQVAWAFMAVGEDEQERLARLQPTKAIKGLERLYPTARSLYRQLSSIAHLGLRQHQKRFERADGKNLITQREPTVVHGTVAILLLCDIWLAVWEVSQARHLSRLDQVVLAEEDYRLVPDRPFKSQMMEQIGRARQFQAAHRDDA